MADISITPANAIKVTLLIFVTLWALTMISNATGIGKGLVASIRQYA